MTHNINSAEIKRLINCNERSKLDFKREWYAATDKNEHEIIKDFIALTNGNIFNVGKNAYLIIGVKDIEGGENTLHNIQLAQDITIIKKQILQNIRYYANPPIIDFEIDYVLIESTTLLVIRIPPHPYLIKLKKQIFNNYYRVNDILCRSGEGTVIASLEEACAHKLALEKYNNTVKLDKNRNTLSNSDVKDKEKHKETYESKNYNIAKKVCLINTGGFGMTSIAAGILRPKHPSTRVLQIYGINTFLRVSNSSIMPISEIEKIFQMIINEDELIVDVASIVALDFMTHLADYKGTANDFDRYVIPTESSQYSREKTIYTVKRLVSLGVLTKEIRVIFNMNNSYRNTIEKAFSKTIEELEKIGVKCNTSAIIPISKPYFEKFYTSNTEHKKTESNGDTKGSYELNADGTDGTILHQRARKSLAKYFFEINEYIYSI